MRQVNDAGLTLLKLKEGLRLRPYLDVKGIPTVGFGHVKGVKYPGEPITEQQAEEYLREDLHEAQAGVERLVTVPLTDNQYAGLVVFIFNIGVHAFSESTTLRALNDGDYSEAATAMLMWNKVTIGDKKVFNKGLYNRRLQEKQLFETP